MQIGCLGNITFEVSDSVLKTIRGASWSGSANIQSHARHLDVALPEFVGVEPDSFTFSIRISKNLGADPVKDIEKIIEYERNGIALFLTIGTISYGSYKWLIQKHKITFEQYERNGDLSGVDISITLKEYPKTDSTVTKSTASTTISKGTSSTAGTAAAVVAAVKSAYSYITGIFKSLK